MKDSGCCEVRKEPEAEATVRAAEEHVRVSPIASPKIRALMMRLLAACEDARTAERPVWDLAVAIECLRELGFADNDLRWLVCKGYVEHARETTAGSGMARTFLPRKGLNFCPRTCFVLTEPGKECARVLCESPR